jgi:hypothetical protein
MREHAARYNEPKNREQEPIHTFVLSKQIQSFCVTAALQNLHRQVLLDI